MRSGELLESSDEELFGMGELVKWQSKPPEPLATQTHKPKMKVAPLGGLMVLKAKVAIELPESPTWRASTMTPPRGATFIFGSWACVANGSGSFDSHLTNSPTPKSSTSEDSNKLARSHDRVVMLLPDLAKEIEPKLENNSSSTRTQIDLKPKSTRIGTLIAQPTFGREILGK